MSTTGDFVLAHDLTVNIFRTQPHQCNATGTTGPLWAVREFDMKVLRIRHPKKARAGPSEQAIRAAIRQAMLNLKLRIEQANKVEIRILKEQGVLGKRAPSCTLLNSFDTIKLLKAFGRKRIGLKFIQAVKEAYPHLSDLLEKEWATPIPPHHRAVLEADFGSSDDGESGDEATTTGGAASKPKPRTHAPRRTAVPHQPNRHARLQVAGASDFEDDEEEDTLGEVDWTKKTRALACRRRMMQAVRGGNRRTDSLMNSDSSSNSTPNSSVPSTPTVHSSPIHSFPSTTPSPTTDMTDSPADEDPEADPASADEQEADSEVEVESIPEIEPLSENEAEFLSSVAVPHFRAKHPPIMPRFRPIDTTKFDPASDPHPHPRHHASTAFERKVRAFREEVAELVRKKREAEEERVREEARVAQQEFLLAQQAAQAQAQAQAAAQAAVVQAQQAQAAAQQQYHLQAMMQQQQQQQRQQFQLQQQQFYPPQMMPPPSQPQFMSPFPPTSTPQFFSMNSTESTMPTSLDALGALFTVANTTDDDHSHYQTLMEDESFLPELVTPSTATTTAAAPTRSRPQRATQRPRTYDPDSSEGGATTTTSAPSSAAAPVNQSATSTTDQGVDEQDEDYQEEVESEAMKAKKRKAARRRERDAERRAAAAAEKALANGQTIDAEKTTTPAARTGASKKRTNSSTTTEQATPVINAVQLSDSVAASPSKKTKLAHDSILAAATAASSFTPSPPQTPNMTMTATSTFTQQPQPQPPQMISPLPPLPSVLTHPPNGNNMFSPPQTQPFNHPFLNPFVMPPLPFNVLPVTVATVVPPPQFQRELSPSSQAFHQSSSHNQNMTMAAPMEISSQPQIEASTTAASDMVMNTETGTETSPSSNDLSEAVSPSNSTNSNSSSSQVPSVTENNSPMPALVSRSPSPNSDTMLPHHERQGSISSACGTSTSSSALASPVTPSRPGNLAALHAQHHAHLSQVDSLAATPLASPTSSMGSMMNMNYDFPTSSEDNAKMNVNMLSFESRQSSESDQSLPSFMNTIPQPCQLFTPVISPKLEAKLAELQQYQEMQEQMELLEQL